MRARQATRNAMNARKRLRDAVNWEGTKASDLVCRFNEKKRKLELELITEEAPRVREVKTAMIARFEEKLEEEHEYMNFLDEVVENLCDEIWDFKDELLHEQMEEDVQDAREERQAMQLIEQQLEEQLAKQE
jgi:hypothetical protein